MSDTTKIRTGKVNILGITPGTDPANPILLTISFEDSTGKVLAVKGLSLTEADNLQAQLNWSLMDWQERRNGNAKTH